MWVNILIGSHCAYLILSNHPQFTTYFNFSCPENGMIHATNAVHSAEFEPGTKPIKFLVASLSIITRIFI